MRTRASRFLSETFNIHPQIMHQDSSATYMSHVTNKVLYARHRAVHESREGHSSRGASGDTLPACSKYACFFDLSGYQLSTEQRQQSGLNAAFKKGVCTEQCTRLDLGMIGHHLCAHIPATQSLNFTRSAGASHHPRWYRRLRHAHSKRRRQTRRLHWCCQLLPPFVLAAAVRCAAVSAFAIAAVV